MSFPIVQQRGSNDCGVAALATAAAYHGISVDYTTLLEAFKLDPDGTDLGTISRLASRIGLHSRGVEASYDGLQSCPLPAIAQFVSWFGTKHFVVLLAWEPERVFVADPANGLRTLSRRGFRRRHSGYLLLLRPWTR